MPCKRCGAATVWSRSSITDFEAEKSRLESHGLEVEVTDHAWVHWRSMYVQDPEDNTVELVCYDAAV